MDLAATEDESMPFDETERRGWRVRPVLGVESRGELPVGGHLLPRSGPLDGLDDDEDIGRRTSPCPPR